MGIAGRASQLGNLLEQREESILAGAGPPGAGFPELPAARAGADASPVELWLKTRPAEAILLKLLVDWNLAHDLLRSYLPEEDAQQVAEDLSVETTGGWSVIRVGVEGQNGNRE